jgi:formylglycine-generating enzyme required for sulfatase activity
MINDRTLAFARSTLVLDRDGFPECDNRALIYATLQALRGTGDPDLYAELVTERFLAGANERYAVHIEPILQQVPAGTFRMGTDPRDARHFCGESPRHVVELSAFAVSRVPVTNEMFALLDRSRAAVGASEQRVPAVNVTWFDAVVFAAWVGCRLPSEAEWEYSCGAGSEADWCCGTAENLPDYAWYSENSGDRAHPVGTRVPNALGLFDLHGNVWEWCQDDYSAGYYARAPARNPVNEDAAQGGTRDQHTHKVARGGGYLALEEMCRTRFRLHDPAEYWAPDLGFRVAAGTKG